MNEAAHGAPLLVPEMLDRFVLAIQACPSAVTRTRIPKEYWHDHPRAAALPSRALSRQSLREYCAREDVCDVQRVMAVTAWGVAKDPNRKRIGKALEPIATLLARVRDSGTRRAEPLLISSVVLIIMRRLSKGSFEERDPTSDVSTIWASGTLIRAFRSGQVGRT